MVITDYSTEPLHLAHHFLRSIFHPLTIVDPVASAYCPHLGIGLEVGRDARQPVGLRGGVVIGNGNNISPRRTYTSIQGSDHPWHLHSDRLQRQGAKIDAL